MATGGTSRVVNRLVDAAAKAQAYSSGHETYRIEAGITGAWVVGVSGSQAVRRMVGYGEVEEAAVNPLLAMLELVYATLRGELTA